MEGNQQKMREAVVQALRKLQELFVASDEDENLRDDCERLLRTAIAAPARQCDVGTPEEQDERFRDMCEQEKCGRYRCKWSCKATFIDMCALAWAQTPYEAQEGGAE